MGRSVRGTFRRFWAHGPRQVDRLATGASFDRSCFKGARNNHANQHPKAIVCHPRDSIACETVGRDNPAPRRTAKSTLVFTLLRSPAKIAPAYGTPRARLCGPASVPIKSWFND